MSDTLQPLREAIKTGDVQAVIEALPEPPAFLSVLFSLDADDRDSIIAGLLPVLEDLDQWEVIEAASVDSVVHPERGAFLSVISLIPADLLADSRLLVSRFSDAEVVRALHQALDERADALNVAA
jgi:hypothetical protein